MCVILKFILTTCLIAPCVAMSTEFRRVFYWTNADQVLVTCNSSKIVQFCGPDRQSCRNMSVPGVLLEKHGPESNLTLIITDSKYNSCSCEACGYINDTKHLDYFTVNLSNQKYCSTPPCPETTSPLPITGNNDSQSGTIAPWVSVAIVFLVVVLVVLVVLIYFYRRRNPNEEENIEARNRFLQ